MILPIGHDEGSVRRWPVVTIAVILLCLLVQMRIGEADPEVAVQLQERGAEAIQYWVERPWLELEPEVAGRYSNVVELVRHNEGDTADRPTGATVRLQQEELDRLTAEWKAARGDSPFVRYGLIPSQFEAGDLVTSIFVHADWIHFLANMFFLWLVGPALEDIWGRLAFGAFFLAAGILAGLAWVAIYPASSIPCIGASGAIAGLMGAFAVRYRFTRIHFAYFFFLIPIGLRTGTFSAPAWLMLGLWAARETLFGTASGGGSGVAHWVHVAGFGSGVAGALLLGKLDLETKVERALGDPRSELRNDALEQGYELRARGDHEGAWEVFRAEVKARAGNPDVTMALWDLAIDLGRADQVATEMLQLIRRELQQREVDLALRHWDELREHVPDVRPAVELRIRLADAMVDVQMDREATQLLAAIEEDLPEGTPSGLVVRAARAACRVGSASAPVLVERALADPVLPEETREELGSQLAKARGRGLVGGAASGGPRIDLDFGELDLPTEAELPSL